MFSFDGSDYVHVPMTRFSQCFYSGIVENTVQ